MPTSAKRSGTRCAATTSPSRFPSARFSTTRRRRATSRRRRRASSRRPLAPGRHPLPLSDVAHESIADSAEVHVYSKGETIIRHGTAGESMFVVDSGSVSVRVPDDSTAGVHEVAQLGEGDVFGEMALLTGETRPADVVALTDVIAIEIGKDALQPLLVAHPGARRRISEQIAQRREDLDAIREESPEEAQDTVLSRIRDWFGL